MTNDAAAPNAILQLQSAGYSPPTSYAIIGDLPNTPYAPGYIYDCIEKLKQSGWFRGLAQYGITRLDWAGYNDKLTYIGPSTIHILLPQNAAAQPGFLKDWIAFHGEDAPNWIYCWCPDGGGGIPELMVSVTHELFEALTDAQPGYGWINTQNNNEGADQCEANTDILLGDYHVSPYYSNELGRCFAQGDM